MAAGRLALHPSTRSTETPRHMVFTPWHQVAIMRRVWPGFCSIRATDETATWQGNLHPLSQSYTIEVTIWCSNGRRPHVTVIDPLLRSRPGLPIEAIPHHYSNPQFPTRPILCLYDPKELRWHCGFPAANTLIPWTVDWLACYEGWLATGEWTGGGRHPPRHDRPKPDREDRGGRRI